MMEAMSTSEMSVNCNQMTQYSIPGDGHGQVFLLSYSLRIIILFTKSERYGTYHATHFQ
jgi:hypothetical protein